MATRRIGDDSWNVTTLAGDQLATRSSVVNAPINTILYFKASNIALSLVIYIFTQTL